jgi:hypothetical protein
MTRLTRLPDRNIQRVILGRVAGPATVLVGQPQGLSVAQARPVRGRLVPEIDAAPALIRGVAGEQPLSQPDHLLHVPVRAGLMRRGTHVQGCHVLLEVELLHRRERVVRRAGPMSRRVQHVVHIGDVPAHLRFGSQEAQGTAQRIDPDERGRVTEMRHVIRSDPARVNPRPVQDRQPPAGQNQSGSRPGSMVRRTGSQLDVAHRPSVRHHPHHRSRPGQARVSRGPRRGRRRCSGSE